MPLTDNILGKTVPEGEHPDSLLSEDESVGDWDGSSTESDIGSVGELVDQHIWVEQQIQLNLDDQFIRINQAYDDNILSPQQTQEEHVNLETLSQRSVLESGSEHPEQENPLDSSLESLSIRSDEVIHTGFSENLPEVINQQDLIEESDQGSLEEQHLEALDQSEQTDNNEKESEYVGQTVAFVTHKGEVYYTQPCNYVAPELEDPEKDYVYGENCYPLRVWAGNPPSDDEASTGSRNCFYNIIGPNSYAAAYYLSPYTQQDQFLNDMSHVDHNVLNFYNLTPESVYSYSSFEHSNNHNSSPDSAIHYLSPETTTEENYYDASQTENLNESPSESNDIAWGSPVARPPRYWPTDESLYFQPSTSTAASSQPPVQARSRLPFSEENFVNNIRFNNIFERPPAPEPLPQPERPHVRPIGPLTPEEMAERVNILAAKLASLMTEQRRDQEN